jgi:peroxin-14
MSGPSRQPPREDLLHNAILFLNDPQVQTSSLASKISFLEGKGLNEDEIQEAIRRARSGQGSTSGVTRSYERQQQEPLRYAGGGDYGYAQGVMRAPEPPKRDWRDLFVSYTLGSREREADRGRS